MSKKIKKHLMKRELKRLQRTLKKHWIWLLAVLAPGIILLVLHYIKKQAKKRIRNDTKDVHNVKYLAKIDQGFAQIEAGEGTTHELMDADD